MNRLLLTKIRALGDTVLLTAHLDEVRRRFPEALITVIVPERWKAVLADHPAVHEVWGVDLKKIRSAAGFFSLWQRIRKMRFDAAICLHASPTIAWLIRLAGISRRAIHFHGHQDQNRFSTVEITGKGQLFPAIVRDALCFEALFGQWPRDLVPRVVVNSKTLSRALPEKGPVLAICPAASRPTKSWTIEGFAEVAQRWLETRNGSIVLIGSDLERTTLNSVYGALVKKLPGLQGRVSIAADLTLEELMALLAKVDLFLGNDSGPKHLAVALGRPTITLFGPEDPFEWHPYSRKSHPYLFVPNLPCRKSQTLGLPAWCGVETCVEEKHQCMTGISSDEVWLHVEKLVPR
ncbi:MAG: glycosyltransferase family 9 protein [Bdellovibrionales bacterium]|nr:glycosyltransferase family 9 protein [Bdellovibrionales bacterium]